MKLEEMKKGMAVEIRLEVGGKFVGIIEDVRYGDTYPVRVRISWDTVIFTKPEEVEELSQEKAETISAIGSTRIEHRVGKPQEGLKFQPGTRVRIKQLIPPDKDSQGLVGYLGTPIEIQVDQHGTICFKPEEIEVIV